MAKIRKWYHDLKIASKLRVKPPSNAPVVVSSVKVEVLVRAYTRSKGPGESKRMHRLIKK